MDPVTIISLVETCGALAMSASKLAVGLKALAENYMQASMTFRSVSTQCNLFACSVRAIEQWMSNMPDGHIIDQSIEHQLVDSLACASDVIRALEAEVKATSGGDVNTFWQRTKVIWNQQAMRELEDSIMKQISSISVILQVMNLPTKQKQVARLKQQEQTFRDSHSSAIFVMGDDKTVRWHCSSTDSAARTDCLRSQLPKYDAENALRNSQAYLRNRQVDFVAEGPYEGSEQADQNATACQTPSHARELPIEHQCAKWEEREHVLLSKYSKVKRYYFEVESQRQLLEEKVKRIRNVVTKMDIDIGVPLDATNTCHEPTTSRVLHSQLELFRSSRHAVMSQKQEILSILDEAGAKQDPGELAVLEATGAQPSAAVACYDDDMTVPEMLHPSHTSIYGWRPEVRRKAGGDEVDFSPRIPTMMI